MDGNRSTADLLDRARCALLLVGTTEELTPLELFDGEAAVALVGITVAGRGEALLDAWWCRHPNTPACVVELGAEMRSAGVATVDTDQSSASTLRGLSLDRLDELPTVLTACRTEWADSQTVVFAARVDELLTSVGLASTYDCLNDLIRLADADSTVYASVPATTSAAVVAGLAPLFDSVVELSGTDDGVSVTPPELSADISLDRVFGLLESPRRRALLRALDDLGGAASLDDLVSAVAARLTGSLAEHPRRLRISLYQIDAPKLADAGVIEFDRDRDVVSIRPDALMLWPYLDVAARSDLSHTAGCNAFN